MILLNCVTLGMFIPCEDAECNSQRCKILKVKSSFCIHLLGCYINVRIIYKLLYLCMQTNCTTPWCLFIADMWPCYLCILCSGIMHKGYCNGSYWQRLLSFWNMEPPWLFHCFRGVRNSPSKQKFVMQLFYSRQ